MSPKIHSSFWSDAEVENLTPFQKLTFVWLMSNSQINVCGFCQVTPRRFVFETGMPYETLLETIKLLPDALIHFPETHIVYVRNFIRHQLGDGEQLKRNRIFSAVLSVCVGITHEPLRKALLEDYPVIRSVYVSPSEEISECPEHGDQIPINDQVMGKEKEKDQEKEKAKENGESEGVKLKSRAKTEAEVIAYVLEVGLPEADGQWFWNKMLGSGWKNNGKPVADWRAVIRTWRLNGYLPSQKGTNASAVSLTDQMRAIEGVIRRHKANPQNGNPTHTITQQERDDYKKLLVDRADIQRRMAEGGRGR